MPDWSFLPTFRSLNEKFKQRQKRDFDRHHGVRQQSVIPEDTPVWITSGENPVPGQIVSQAVNPRSYIVGTQYGQLCMNQQHINVNRSAEATTTSTMTRNTPGESRSPIMTRLRTGTAIRPPNRLVSTDNPRKGRCGMNTVNYNDYVLHYVPSMYTTLIDCTCTFLRCYIPTLLVCYLRCCILFL